MRSSTSPVTRHDDAGKLLLRLTIGGLLLPHGIAKLSNGIGWMGGMLGGIGLPAFIGYGVYVGEIIAPVLLLAGKFSRPAGLVVAFNMLVAVLLARRDSIAKLNRGGGWDIEVEMLFLLGGLAIWFLGSGRFALSRGEGRWD
ncbi:MAG TPA: DoxX family protein [Gemmatimonadaceae bacterium]|nr:DoxX family protein [Gemmatimonadaceae bacterium]